MNNFNGFGNSRGNKMYTWHKGNTKFLVIVAIIIVVPALLTFIYKSVFGYYKMEYVGEDNYKISTYSKTERRYSSRRHRRRTVTYYYVEFAKEGSGTIRISADRSYYNNFQPYNGTSRHVQVYKCVDNGGTLFPVTFMERNERKASQECGRVYTPPLYSIWYRIAIIGGAAFLIMAFNSNRTANNYRGNARAVTPLEQEEMNRRNQETQNLLNEFDRVMAEKNKYGQYNDHDLK